jgi:hypothetical protein
MTPIACLPLRCGKSLLLGAQTQANLAQLMCFATKNALLLPVKRLGAPNTLTILAFLQKTIS